MKNKIILTLLCLSTISCSSVNYVDKRLNAPPAGSCDGATPPQLVTGAAPSFPMMLKLAGIEGFVILKLDIAKNGEAENISVVTSRPAGTFDRYALEAAKKWKYKPANLNGEILTTKNDVTLLKFCITDKKHPREHRDPMCADAVAENRKVMSTISIPRRTCKH